MLTADLLLDNEEALDQYTNDAIEADGDRFDWLVEKLEENDSY